MTAGDAVREQSLSSSARAGSQPRTTAGPAEAQRFLVVFAVLASFMGMSVGMAQVTTSLYAVKLGVSATMLALIAGAQSIGVLLVSLPVGVLVDRFGPRLPFLIGTTAAGLIYGYLSIEPNASLLLLGTALISFFMPLRFVALNTIFLHQLAELGETKAGWYRATHMLGMFLLGPALGARIVSDFGFGASYGSIALSFFATLFLSALVFGPYPVRAVAVRELSLKTLGTELGSLIGDKELRSVSLLEIGTQAVSAFFTFFIVVVAVQRMHFDETAASALVSTKGITFIAALFSLGGLIQWLGQRRAYSINLTLIAGSLFSLGLGASANFLWVGALGLGLGLGGVQIANLQRYAQIGARTGHGRVSGLNALVGPSGGILGSVLGGVLGRSMGLQQVFAAAGAGFALWALSFARNRPT